MLSQSLIDSVKHHEGLRLRAYQDSVGVWTIGYGRNLQALQITAQQAEAWLIEDLEAANRKAATLAGFHSLSQNRKDVLIEMCFNLGLTRLLKFSRTLASIAGGHYDRAADEMLESKWAKQVGQRARTMAEKMRQG